MVAAKVHNSKKSLQPNRHGTRIRTTKTLVKTCTKLVFVVKKCSYKICRSKKYTIIKSLTSLDVRPQRIIKKKWHFMWDILLPTPADYENAFSRDLISKDRILRT